MRELVQRGVLIGEHGGYLCRGMSPRSACRPRCRRPSGAHRPTDHPGQADAQRGVGDRRPLRRGAARRAGDRCGGRRTAERGADRSGAVTPTAEYAFHHPLIRAVAYESQLKSDRAQWHRRLAAAIEIGQPGIGRPKRRADRRTSEAAGDGERAYGWHMRAGAWSTHRDIAAARVELGACPPNRRRAARRRPGPFRDAIAPRTMLCVAPLRVRASSPANSRNCGSCDAAGDKASLAVGMTGPAVEPYVRARA